MSNHFQNKYRGDSIRLQNWDYRWAGSYFITICTKDRIHYFGEVQHGEMKLSQIGVIADLCWCEIKNHAKNIELEEFIIMPNHMHGIITINGNNEDKNILDKEGKIIERKNQDKNENPNPVRSRHALNFAQPLTQPFTKSSIQQRHAFIQTIGQKRFQNQGKNSLSSILGSYKSAVTKHARRLGFQFAWQPNYYEHIIRNQKAFENISNYIRNNPKKWGEDKFHRRT